MNFNVITYFYSKYKNKECEEKKMVNTSNDEMEKLQKLRTELERRLATIEEEQKTVEEETNILREKAAIRELEKKVREKQDALASLRIKKKELEDQIKAPTKLSISEAIQKTKAEIENKKNALETEKEEQPKVIWKKDEQTPESKEPQEDENTKSAEDESKESQEDESKESQEDQDKKKKLRFF